MKVGDLVRNLQTPASEPSLLGLIVAPGPEIKKRKEKFYVINWLGRYNGETSVVSENEIEVLNESRGHRKVHEGEKMGRCYRQDRHLRLANY
mgnify:FL=1